MAHIFVIQQWIAGATNSAGEVEPWQDARDSTGQLFWFFRKSEAQINLRSLNDRVPGRYRIIQVRD